MWSFVCLVFFLLLWCFELYLSGALIFNSQKLCFLLVFNSQKLCFLLVWSFEFYLSGALSFTCLEL